MKEIAEKHDKLSQALEDVTGIDDAIKANIRRCLAIYVNGEILKSFNKDISSCGKVPADMIAFFYLHLQMSGAANECLSKEFTSSCPGLSRGLFDETLDGKGIARLPRFAGAHAQSLAMLLQDFTPKLVQDYIRIMHEVLPVVKQSILLHVPSLEILLNQRVKISFSPMTTVDFSSPQFKVVAPHQSQASLLLEALKTIDLVAPTLCVEQRDRFYESHSGQVLALMARQILANNIYELQKQQVLSDDEAFDELRQYRNCSAHGLVMWEIQNNPQKLRFNCERLVLGTKEVLVDCLKSLYPGIYESYLNPPSLEIPKEVGERLPECRKPKKKKKKIPVQAVQAEPEIDNAKFLAKRAKQRELMDYYLIDMASNPQGNDPISILRTALAKLEEIHAILPELLISDIFSTPLTVIKVSKQGASKIKMEAVLASGRSPFSCDVMTSNLSPQLVLLSNNKLKKNNLYFIEELFCLFCANKELFTQSANINLFKQVLKKAFDLGASPNIMSSNSFESKDLLFFSVRNMFPQEIIMLLLEHGANPNLVVEKCVYIGALHYAARLREDILLPLLQAGANPLALVHDPFAEPPVKCSIFSDIVMCYDYPVKTRLASLRILYLYMYQKYGSDAVLANMRAPIVMYLGDNIIKTVNIKELNTLVLNDPIHQLPCAALNRLVETVLSNPAFSFHKLVLNNELKIMVQAIDELHLPQKILAAMDVVSQDASLCADNFALELGLLPLYQYLNRVYVYCHHVVSLAPFLDEAKGKVISIIASYAMENTLLANLLSTKLLTLLSATLPDNAEVGKGAPITYIRDLIADYLSTPPEQQSIAYLCL